MDRLVARIMQDFSLDLYEPIYPRALDLGTPLLPRAGNLVSVVVGMRRSGKTYRLFQEMRRLLDDGVPPAQMLYFNFEDDRLKPLTSAVGDAVLDTFFELHPEAHERGGIPVPRRGAGDRGLGHVAAPHHRHEEGDRVRDRFLFQAALGGTSPPHFEAARAEYAALGRCASGSSSGATSRRCSAAARWTAAR